MPQCLELRTDAWGVLGLNPGRAASELWQFRLHHFASVFRRTTLIAVGPSIMPGEVKYPTQVTYLVGRLWTFSIWLIWVLVWGSQTAEAYSNCGLTSALLAWDFSSEDLIFKFLFKKPKDWFALLVIEFMCLFQFRLLWSVMTKHLECSTLARGWSCNL